MDETHDPFFVHQHLGRHPAEFEQLDLLPIQFQYPVLRVWQSSKGQPVSAKIRFELLRLFRPDHQDDHLPLDEPFMILAQLRQVRAAEGSLESPVQNQQDMLFPLILR